ncbi:MAG: TldD/PmbA family protein [Caedimonadaceae bacterium]|nr:MAG: TldD/PmbA family protein [Caedimonadaceae bacterium]
MSLTYSGEESLFIRLNQSKVRQASEVIQGYLTMDFISHHSHTKSTFLMTGDLSIDLKTALEVVENCREECKHLPDDPYLILPQQGENSNEEHYGILPEIETIAAILLKPAHSHDLVGLLTSGTLMRSYMNSKGQFHWFSTDSFSFDYSLYTSSQKAIKAIYAGTHWQNDEYSSHIEKAKKQLKILEKPPKKITPGRYRAYFTPEAVAEFVSGFYWSGLSGSALMQGRSPFKKLYEGRAYLSSLFSLEENFHKGLTPRFNEFGDIAPLSVPLITKGKLLSPLINHRTAQEYNLQSNAANEKEQARSPLIRPGHLKEEMALSKLGTGLYISNLHYLNWSDLQHGRLTGMTRYGCFWVENGEIVSPIEDLRFDETLYHFWGDALEDLGDQSVLVPKLFSYGERSLGGAFVPSMLVRDFSFTS